MDNAIAIDKWYYIMDKSFYFYRLNNNSQLVAATNKAEADIFSYEEARERIGTGRKAQFYTIVPAEEDVAMLSNAESVKSDLVVMDGTSQQQRISEYQLIEQDTYDLSELDWKEYVTQFSYIASSVNKYHDELTVQLSEVDQKICDIMHYIEMYDLSDGESLSVMEQLKAYREHRRDIKDNMLISDTFRRLIGTSNNIAKSKETIKAITGLEKRKYTPRQLTELFEGKSLNVPKKITKFPERIQEETMPVQEEEEKMENVIEEYVWEETVFDTQHMDWKQYAKQQKEFFEQARQYSYNLQIELEEIDGRIQDILVDVEDANYNAVQGFHVFKQLKELRNMRKEKLKELECVETLTGCFDCAYMQEAYGYCVGEIEKIMKV